MKNTIAKRTKRTSVNPKAGDFGDSGDFVASAANSAARSVKIIDGVIDQHKHRWVKVSDGTHECWLPVASLIGGGATAASILEELGIILISSSSLREFTSAVELFTKYRNAAVMDRPGWWGGIYLHGSGKIIAPKANRSVPIVTLRPMAKFEASGTAESWLEAFTPFMKGQDALLVCLGIVLMGPLIGVLRGTPAAIENPIYDWCGGSSAGKTTAAIKFAGSVWGYRPDSPVGFGETWFATAAGLSRMLPAHNDSFLGLDEAHLASENRDARARIIANAIHTIEKGTEKTTHHTGLVESTTHLVCVSTSNDPLTSYLLGSAKSIESIQARLVSFHVPKRAHGILKTLPDGYKTSGAAIDELNTLLTQHFGAPALTFLEKLVTARAEDHGRLVALIQRHRDRLLAALKIDKSNGIEYRRAKPYAIAYAATHLARAWGVLPKKKAAGSYLQAFIDVWRWTAVPAAVAGARDPASTLRRYCEENRVRFSPTTSVKPLSETEMMAAPGFLHHRKDGTEELLIPPAKFKREFGFVSEELRTLANNGILVGEGGENARFDTKRTVRCDRLGKVMKDRLFVIRLNRL